MIHEIFFLSQFFRSWLPFFHLYSPWKSDDFQFLLFSWSSWTFFLPLPDSQFDSIVAFESIMIYHQSNFLLSITLDINDSEGKSKKLQMKWTKNSYNQHILILNTQMIQWSFHLLLSFHLFLSFVCSKFMIIQVFRDSTLAGDGKIK